MRKIIRPKHLNELNEKFSFGIHKGKTVEYVITHFPDYIEWAITKSGFITFSDKIREAYRSNQNLSR